MRSAFARRHGDRDDFFEEAAFGYGLPCLFQGGERVLGVAAKLVGFRTVLSEAPHKPPFIVSVFQAIQEHMVDDPVVPGAIAGTCTIEQIRRVGHALHATRHNDGGGASCNAVVGQHCRHHAGAAHLVYGRRANDERQASGDGCLARGRLALTGGQHAADQHLIDEILLDPGSLQGSADNCGAKLRGGNILEGPLEPAKRRPGNPGR
jgi:hypothetical protein